MNLERVFNLGGQIIALAVVAVVLSSPNTARVITSAGSAFTGSVRTAMGR